MRRDLPSGTLTFLFTDVEGSTRLLAELGDGYAEALAQHRNVLREAFATHGGFEVDTQGDAFFYVFPSARDAFAAAEQAQRALAAGPIAVRMGLHTGEARVSSEGYVGLDVHRAARIAAAGHGGQVLVSASTASLLDASDSPLVDLGEHRLKDLSAPERIYQAGAGVYPPLKTLYRTNLPVPATPFLGRERDRLEVTAALRRDDPRLLTLTGVAGSGKTRLALQASGEVTDSFPDGVFWVELAPLRDPSLVPAQAAQALGVAGTLAEYVSDRRLLLVLDNFEHVLEAAAGVVDLIARCPNLKVLVTSREPLRLSVERQYEVRPLDEEDAVGLFHDRALSQEPQEAVRAICLRLDCLPLAIELAAARTKALSGSQILERLDERLSLLTGGPRDAPPRQQTLRATIDWSYELLSPQERRLFAGLAVFAGGCTLDAAEEILRTDVDRLQSLVDKSLLRRAGRRYELLETIREYSLGRLRISAAEQDVRRRHAEHFLEQAEREEATTRFALRDPEVLERLRPDRDNFRGAFAWSSGAGLHELAARLAVVGAWFSVPWLEWRRMLDVGLEYAGTAGIELRMELLERAGAMAKETGDHERGRALSNELLDLARANGHIGAEAAALANLADIALIEGELDSAKELYEREIELLEQLGDTKWVVAVRHVLGEVELMAGRLDTADRILDDALAAARGDQNDRLAAKILHSRGDLELEQGRPAQAGEAYRESARLARPYGETKNALYCLAGLAAVAAAGEDAAGSGRLWGAAEGVAVAEGLPLHADARARYERFVAPVRVRAEFQAGEEAGRALTPDAALDTILA